jgi:hypothetical protein
MVREKGKSQTDVPARASAVDLLMPHPATGAGEGERLLWAS